MKMEIRHNGKEAYVKIQEALPPAHAIQAQGVWYVVSTEEQSEEIQKKWDMATPPGD